MQTGLAFHCHHDVLVEWVYDYEERVRFIKSYKPLGEQELRLRLFRLIPEDRLPEELVKALSEWDTAWSEWETAQDAWGKALSEWVKTPSKWETARFEWEKAQAACYAWEKALFEWKKVFTSFAPSLEKLHRELCPNCPFDGKTIF